MTKFSDEITLFGVNFDKFGLELNMTAEPETLNEFMTGLTEVIQEWHKLTAAWRDLFKK